MVNIISLIAGGIVGALLTLGTKWTEEWWDRRRRRRSLAMSLLVELRSLEISLRGIVNDPNLTLRPWGITAHFFVRAREGALCDLSLLKPQSVYEVMKFGGYVAAAEGEYAKFKGGGIGQPTEQHVRFQASIAACRVPAVKSALVAEGAAIPDDQMPEQARYPQVPELPPEAFGPWHTRGK